jgi:hypothetical protein
MEGLVVTNETQTAWQCPKDGTVMQPPGRRSRAWRCPKYRGIFIDTEAMRRGRRAKPPVWAPVVLSVTMSVLATLIARRFFRHSKS